MSADDLKPITLSEARAAQAEVERRLAQTDGVNGIGVGRGPDGFLVRVYFETSPPVPRPVPETIRGVPVVIETIGPIHGQ